jgi:uncharacterized protein
MRFAEASDSGGTLVEAYGPEGIRVGGRLYPGPIVLTPGRPVEAWGAVGGEPGGAADPARIDPERLRPLLDLRPEAIVLGTGPTQCFPDPALYREAAGLGIGIEVMDTGAACRTYNILVAEGRRVVAALLPL